MTEHMDLQEADREWSSTFEWRRNLPWHSHGAGLSQLSEMEQEALASFRQQIGWVKQEMAKEELDRKKKLAKRMRKEKAKRGKKS